MTRLLCLIVAFALWVPNVSFAAYNPGRESVDDDPVVEIGSSTQRVSLTIVNTSTTVTLYCGHANVTSATGFPILPTSSFTFNEANAAFLGTPAAYSPVYCVTASGTVDVGYWEVYR